MSFIMIAAKLSAIKNHKNWHWIILFIATINATFLGCKSRTFNNFAKEIQQRNFRNVTIAELNWIGDAYTVVALLTPCLLTALIINYTKWQQLFQFLGACLVLLGSCTGALVHSAHLLFLTHSLVHGIGSSLIVSTIGLVVNDHFDKKHRYHIFATTLISNGSVASIIFVSINEYLIEQFGWRLAFVVLGIVYFGISCVGAVVFTNSLEVKQSQSPQNYFQCVTKFHAPLLVLWTVDRIMTGIVTYGLIINTNQSPIILFLAGEVSAYVLAVLITSITRDNIKNKIKYILLISTGFAAISLTFWEFVANIRVLSEIFSFLSGFFIGQSLAFMFPGCEEMTMLPGHLAYPFSLGGLGLGMLLAPALSGVISLGFQYKGLFLVHACIITIKFICLLFLCILSKKLSIILPVEYCQLSSQSNDDRDSTRHSKRPGSSTRSDEDENIDITIR